MGLIQKNNTALKKLHMGSDFLIVFFSPIFVYVFFLPDSRMQGDIFSISIVSSVLYSYFANKAAIYRSWRTLSLQAEIQSSILTLACVVLCMLLVGYLTNSLFNYPRDLIFTWFFSTCAALTVFRLGIRKALHTIRTNGFNSRKAAIIGNGLLAQQLAKDISTNEHMGIEIVGYYDDRKEIREHLENAPETSVIGDFQSALDAAKRNAFDDIYIALPMKAERKILEIIKALRDCSLSVHFVPDLLTCQLLSSNTVSVGNIPLVNIYQAHHS